jgi:hypothetical protein
MVPQRNTKRGNCTSVLPFAGAGILRAQNRRNRRRVLYHQALTMFILVAFFSAPISVALVTSQKTDRGF